MTENLKNTILGLVAKIPVFGIQTANAGYPVHWYNLITIL